MTSALPPKADIAKRDHDVRFVPKADMEQLFGPVGVQQEWFRDGEPDRLANGFKLDFGNPVALAPAQARLFIVALEAWWRASEQRRLYILERVDADDGIQAAVDLAGDHRYDATRGSHVKLSSLGAERVVWYACAIPNGHREGSRRTGGPNTAMLRAERASACASRDF